WAAYLLVLAALSLAPLAIVAPVRETAIVAVAAWGVWRLGEREAAGLKLAGAVATLARVGPPAALEAGPAPRAPRGSVGRVVRSGRSGAVLAVLLERGPCVRGKSFEKRSSRCRQAPSRSWFPTAGSGSSRPRTDASTSSTAPAWTRA